jgi:hypothetical protein
MATRIEIELTSERDDGTWTWRAAGARSPKGTVASSLLWQGAKVGDIARAELQRGLDGIEIVAVTPPPAREQADNLIEVLGPERKEPLVTVSLRKQHKGARPNARARRTSDAPSRGDRSATERRPGRTGRSAEGRAGAKRTTEAARTSPRPHAVRLHPGDAHRKAVLEELLPEHRPIGEALLRGGIPSVRAALEEHNAAARAKGAPETPVEATLRIAEDILPKVRIATWLDRAEAAAKLCETLPLKELRSVLAAADRSAKHPRVGELVAILADAADRRAAAEGARWSEEIAAALDAGRIVRALRLSARLPDPSVRLSSELAARLAEAASAEMSPETPPDRWMVLIDAVAGSPVRRQVKPLGFPADAPPELVELAREHANRIPALAETLGVTIPPPPRPEILAMVPKRTVAKK